MFDAHVACDIAATPHDNVCAREYSAVLFKCKRQIAHNKCNDHYKLWNENE